MRALYKKIVQLAGAVVLFSSVEASADYHDKIHGKAIAALYIEKAEQLYATADYQSALLYYKEAYLASPEDEILYNIGNCYKMLGKADFAKENYDLFFRKNIKLSNKLDLTVKQEKKPESAPALLPLDEAAGPLWRAAFVGSAGLAGVGVGVGLPVVVRNIRLNQLNKKLEEGISLEDANKIIDLQERYQGLDELSVVAITTGIVTAGILLVFLHNYRESIRQEKKNYTYYFNSYK